MYLDGRLHLKDKKEITYLSLSWRVENCIEGFFNNLKNGNISDELITLHDIESEVKKGDYEAIQAKVKRNINYEKMLKSKPSKEEIELANSIKTNLTSLSRKQIQALIDHAASLTEVQLKLYHPSILKK